MKKCFWCGAWNHVEDTGCHSCKRSMRMSSFLHSLLRPSIGGILGAQVETAILRIPSEDADLGLTEPSHATR